MAPHFDGATTGHDVSNSAYHSTVTLENPPCRPKRRQKEGWERETEQRYDARLPPPPLRPAPPPAPPLLRACAVRCVEVCARACAKMGGQKGRKRESKRDEREREIGSRRMPSPFPRGVRAPCVLTNSSLALLASLCARAQNLCSHGKRGPPRRCPGGPGGPGDCAQPPHAACGPAGCHSGGSDLPRRNER